jgi:hypothetical protein
MNNFKALITSRLFCFYKKVAPFFKEATMFIKAIGDNEE